MHGRPPAWTLLGVLLALGSVSPWLWPNSEPQKPRAAPPTTDELRGAPAAIIAAIDSKSPCPARQLPAQGVCVPVPEHTDPTGRLNAPGRVLPRDTDKPPNFFRYRWPTQLSEHTRFNVSLGWAQSRGLPQTGITLDESAPASVRLPQLSGQAEAAEVLYVGPALNGSVVTLHHVKDRAGDAYLAVVFGNLRRRAPEATRGVHLAEGTVVGEAGDSDDKDAPSTSLWLACYRLRPGYSKGAWQTFPDNLRDSGALTPVDLRDVLPYL